MTSSTSGIPGASGVSGATPAKSIADKSKELGDKDTFLKLLVAQLKYQDPSNPADSTQFLAQTAQFTQVEKLGDIADLLKSQRLTGVSALVGHDVTYMDEMGARQTGTISAAKLNGDSEPMLRIGNTDVLLSKVMEVLPPGSAAGGTTGPAGAAGLPGTVPPAAATTLPPAKTAAPNAAPKAGPATGPATA
jgi:flagellar basal-body rod modification protein FlgD